METLLPARLAHTAPFCPLDFIFPFTEQKFFFRYPSVQIVLFQGKFDSYLNKFYEYCQYS